MLTIAILALCLVQVLYLAAYWLRVTVRDQDASRLRRMRDGLDWEGKGRRRKVRAETSFFGRLLRS
jgi:hypothetical protein